MKYCIFYEDKSLIICEKNYAENLKNNAENFVAAFPESSKMLFNYIQLLEAGSKYTKIILTSNDAKASFKLFKEKFKVIKAGGGLVIDENGNILAIYRRKKWDLPKGKMNKGEKWKETALREVKEETGVENLSIDQKLGNTYHIYKLNKRRILKTTRWYIMKAPNQKLTPQKEEDIEKADWISFARFKKILKKTYPNIKFLLGEKENLIFESEKTKS